MTRPPPRWSQEAEAEAAPVAARGAKRPREEGVDSELLRAFDRAIAKALSPAAGQLPSPPQLSDPGRRQSCPSALQKTLHGWSRRRCGELPALSKSEPKPA